MLAFFHDPEFRWHGAFRDKEREDRYWKDTWTDWSRFSLFSACIFGIVLIGTILPQLDYQIHGTGPLFFTLLPLRLGVAGVFLVVAIIASKTSGFRRVLHNVTCLALLATAVMMTVAASCYAETQFFPILAHAIPLMITFLIIPNRPTLKMFNAAVFAGGFILSLSSDVVAQSQMSVSSLLFSYTFLGCIGLMGSIKRARSNRIQYLRRSMIDKTRDDALEALRHSKMEMQTILENLEDTFFRSDPFGKIIYVTPSVERLLDMPSEEVLGQNLRDFLTDESYLETAKALLQAQNGHLRCFRSPLRHSTQKDRWIETSAGLRFDGQGKLLGIEGTVRDISDLVKAEHMLRHSQKMEAIGHLTGGVAHDFNNLLAVISGNVELMWGVSKEQRDSVQPILEAVGRGKDLTQRLLAFARQQPLMPEPTNISDEVARTNTLLARTLGAQFDLQLKTDFDLWPALVDPGQLENTLINLLINARDAMPKGGAIKIHCRNVHLSAERSVDFTDLAAGDYVVLSVQDCGEGMTPDTMQHAFEPFFSTKEPGKGSGLGLSMVYGFAHQSGGDVVVESTVGVGTKVSIYFPKSKLPWINKPNAVGSVSSKGAGRNILVIEDEPAVKEITLRMLAILGYTAQAVGDGPEALEVLTEKNDFAVVLSDVVLPGKMNGPDIAKKMRSEGNDITFVFMSGYLADAFADPTIVEGDIPFLAKPFKLLELEAALSRAFVHADASSRVDVHVPSLVALDGSR